MSEAKPCSITREQVAEAWRRVRANRGAGGADGETPSRFDKNLEGNLCKVWNRMSSGSYFPPPVKRAEIPKGDGRTRPLGIPTVADRVARMVAKRVLEPLVEPLFHEDSYGYRPGRSARDAVAKARERCWRLEGVRRRLKGKGLELHPEKTEIVCGKDDARRGDHDPTALDFLSYTFRGRSVEAGDGKLFVGFNPVMSAKAKKAGRAAIREWNLTTKWNTKTLNELASFINPIVRGWVAHYGRFHRSECLELLRDLNLVLARWAKRKYERFHRDWTAAFHRLGDLAHRRQQGLFNHWTLGIRPTTAGWTGRGG